LWFGLSQGLTSQFDNICVTTTTSNGQTCLTTPLTVNGDTSVILQPEPTDTTSTTLSQTAGTSPAGTAVTFSGTVTDT
jgi:hypothetical protein